MAEGRGKAQADTLRKAKTETIAHRIVGDTGAGIDACQDREHCRAPAAQVRCGPGRAPENSYPATATSSRAWLRSTSRPSPARALPSYASPAATDRRSPGGTKVLSDWIKVRITSNPGETFLDRMIALVEGAERQKTPNEIALNILLAGLTIIFLLAVVTLASLCRLQRGRGQPREWLRSRGASVHYGSGSASGMSDPDHDRRIAVGHRDCGDGPGDPVQCAGHVGPRGGGGRRRQYALAGQDRDDHARQSPGNRVHPDAGSCRERAGGRGSIIESFRRNARRALDRRARQDEVWSAGAGSGLTRSALYCLHGSNAHVRSRLQWPLNPKRRGRRRFRFHRISGRRRAGGA